MYLLLFWQEGLQKRQEPRGIEGNWVWVSCGQCKEFSGQAVLTTGWADTSLNVIRPLVEFQACCTRVLALWLWMGREGNWGAAGRGDWQGHPASCRGRTGMTDRGAPCGCSCARPAHWGCVNQTSELEGAVWGHWTQVKGLVQGRWQNWDEDCDELPPEGFLDARNCHVCMWILSLTGSPNTTR